MQNQFSEPTLDNIFRNIKQAQNMGLHPIALRLGPRWYGVMMREAMRVAIAADGNEVALLFGLPVTPTAYPDELTVVVREPFRDVTV
jgi:nitroreductase